MMWVMAICALIGGVDQLAGNKFGLGRRFEDGFQLLGLVGLFSADEGILVYHLILCLGNFPSAKDRQQDSTKMPVWHCISYGFLVCYPYSEIQCIL